MGVSLVPMRALALYPQKRTIRRLPLPKAFERELLVVMRGHRSPPQHVLKFVENILF
jgi:DNA-binding transcriptional LysR family regulator